MSHALPPPRRLHRPSGLLHQRPPAETLDGVLAQLRDHCEPVRRRLGRDRLGIGLWLAKDAARALVTEPAALRGLRTELDRRGLEVVTLNGFPYEGFGAQEVKYRVYSPDWADPARLEHTTALARLLAGLLPDDITEGSISTLPLYWRTAADEQRATAARAALRTLGERLDALAELTGRSIRIGLEPEPGCTIETTADAIAPLSAVAHPRIGICVDTCHLATSFEDPGTALDALTRAGVPSSSPSSPRPCTPNTPISPRSARPWPPSLNPASCTRPAPSWLPTPGRRQEPPSPPGCTAPTTSGRPSTTAPSPTPHPGAPTSMSRCTRHPRPPSPPPSPSSRPP